MAYITRSKRSFEQSIRADSSITPASRPQKRRRSGSAPLSPTSTPYQPASTPCQRSQPKPYWTARQKADDILEYMRDRYRWGIKDLIRSLACDPLENSQRNTGNNSEEERTGKIIEAIWGHTEVLYEFEKHTTFPGLSTYKRELEALVWSLCGSWTIFWFALEMVRFQLFYSIQCL